MFNKEVLAHFRNPLNAGELPNATAQVEVSNPVCGDVLRIAARVEDGCIVEARFLCRGCTTAIACASFLTEKIRGRSQFETRDITASAISAGLGGLPQATYHGAQLAADALKALLEKLENG
ncbi:MAG TPA: iron-sulfur cluster assembly scaffold protein [Candidatus Acidoferrum sp.]|nr:iron-sulfur cluster assembly scaffold protein [Candidatus Acidoferrum sp.]